MPLDAPRLPGKSITDEIGRLPDLETTQLADGAVFGFTRSRVDLGDGGVVVREYMDHPGAVAILALRPIDPARPDLGDEALVIRQYRHAVGITEWEIPAGLLDVEGEPPLQAARRELAEEAGLAAATWHTLGQFAPSAGGSTETIRLYLARDLTDTEAPDGFEPTGEEIGMPAAWVDLDDLHDAVLAGRLANAPLQLSVLTAHASRSRGWATLQDPYLPFTLHPAHRA